MRSHRWREPPRRASRTLQSGARTSSKPSLFWTGESRLSPGDSQINRLLVIKDQLFSSGLSSEVQPLPSERTGPE
ncbi:unnamed protein product [Tetraodon nigroviridis]|uniref:(spotted green pufferfish) hypothetical protein n=1 Tax=Tetraodon nigroviridis TaxID=99883 RepID=Q4SXL6_TETNG|nr:unnamed protein product [Tetraodon nigroviridis]